jgi:ribonuclease HI
LILTAAYNYNQQDLRDGLNEATSRQIEAEDIMKEEGDFGDGMMTEAEMTYLTAMEDVKTCSRKLVIAEKSFNLVRERIENLVAKYESLLVKFDNDAESIAPSSVITYESSYYSDTYTHASEEEREREELGRRAQQAEVRAELAARESRLAKHETRAGNTKNVAELQALQKRLDELQSEASTAVTEREHSVVLARAITAKNRSTPQQEQTSINPKRNNIEDVKKRFRDRSAVKKQNSRTGASNNEGDGRAPLHARQLKTPAQRERENIYRQVGEEMFQHLDFYERSLKAVETDRL